MPIRTTIVLIWLLCAATATGVQAQKASQPEAAGAVSSIYTPLTPGKCKTIRENEETGSDVQQCPGVAGYTLLVDGDDSRMSVTVVTPAGKEFPLNYWDVITLAFSHLGDKAEWRVVKQGNKILPIALIVRVNAQENPESSKLTSYLAVAKIAGEQICVTDKIRPNPTANVEARRAADASANKPCFQPSNR
jgi:hypothetical protein